MVLWNRWIWFMVWAGLAAQVAKGQQAQDIAVIVGDHLQIGVLDAGLMKMDDLQQIQAAFEQTSVGEALSRENQPGDWQLVSMRLDVCAPLVKAPHFGARQWCWPEVRLVWQPIAPSADFSWGKVFRWPDDRAIHALYEVHGDKVLTGPESLRAEDYRRRLQEAPQPELALKDGEQSDFFTLRDRVAKELVAQALLLRAQGLGEDAYTRLELRRELQGDEAMAQAFSARLQAFLQRFCSRSLLKAMTAFSLPEGRNPAFVDEWVFLQFKAAGGKLVQENIKIFSRDDGRLLYDYGQAARADMGRDDFRVYDRLDERREDPWSEAMNQHVLLWQDRRSVLEERLMDRSQTLVGNTSCASCHKFNQQNFDFHNLSLFEGQDVTVSPRVRQDVAWELDWIRERLGTM